MLLSFFLLIMFLLFPSLVSSFAKDALYICLNSVIPSLFPFMVAAKMLSFSLPFKKEFFLISFFKDAFLISKNGAIAFVTALFCGYPVGAKIVSEYLREEKISQKEAKRLMLFINNAGPAFTISTVGSIFLSSKKAGVIIYLSHILTSFLTGVILSFFAKEEKITKEKKSLPLPFFKIITLSLTDSVIAVLNVSGIIIFFSSALSFIDILKISSFLPPLFMPVLKGIFEMTSGLKELSEAAVPFIIKASFSSLLISFSGLSVFTQMLSFSSGIKITPVFLIKALSSFISMFFCYVSLKTSVFVVVLPVFIFIFLTVCQRAYRRKSDKASRKHLC